MQSNAWRALGGGAAPARQGADVTVLKSAPPSPKASPARKDVLDFAKYTTLDASKASFSMSMSPWGSAISSNLPDHVPTSLPSSAIRRLNSRGSKRRDDSAQSSGGERTINEPRANSQPRTIARQEKIIGSAQEWRAQLGWDGVSEETWDKLRAQLLSAPQAEADIRPPSSAARRAAADHASPAKTAPGSNRPISHKQPGALPLLLPKMKPSALPSEYRVLKSSLQRAEERATGILQELESNLADSDHMITLNPRWLAQFTESHDDNTAPDPFELSIQRANKLLDFLNQKQREQEACEAMMSQLLDAFNAAEAVRDTQDFSQIVRPSTIADSTGDWTGLQSEFEMQLLKNRRVESFAAPTLQGTGADSALQELESRHIQEIVKLTHEMTVQHAKAMEAQRKELEAKDMRIENVVATLGKVLKEREYLKSELQRAGHHSVVQKMKLAAANERDMLKSIKDQITGKVSAAVEDRGMQTMEVQFADDRDSDDDDAANAAASQGLARSRASEPAMKGAALNADLAAAFKNIYEKDESKQKKKAKGGQDWSFMDIDAFTKEVVRQGLTFQGIVGDVKLPREWQKSLKVPPKAGDDSRGRILTIRVLLKIINDIYTERFKAGTSAGPLVTFVQEYFLERYGLKELADIHMRNFVTSVIFFAKTDGNSGPGIVRTVTFARLVGMFNGFGAAELDWYFSCRQDLFTHVDHLCCFDLDDSATKVTITRALDHMRRMFVILQMSAERAVRELDEIEKSMKQPRAMFQVATNKKDAVHKFAEKVMRSNMKPIDLLLRQPEDVIDVDALFARLIEIFNEFQVERRLKLQRAFLDADEDGDGEMDFDEFKALCSSVGRGIKAPALRAMFREMTEAADEAGKGITPEIFAAVALKHNLDRMIGGPKGDDDDDNENVGSWDALSDAWATDCSRILTAMAMIPDPLPDSAKTKTMLRDAKIEMDDILEKRDGLCGRRQAWAKYRHIMKKTSEVQRKNEILAKVARIMKGKKPKDKLLHAENLLRFCMRRRWINLHLRDFSSM